MKKSFLCLSFILWSMLVFSQDDPAFGIKFSGFVKTDIIWDSRQTVDLREGHFLLLPKPELPDEAGKDINAKASFNFKPVSSPPWGEDIALV